MPEFYPQINWFIPYYKSNLAIALPSNSVLQLFLSCELKGMKISSSSPFNQGIYKVRTNNNEVEIRGAYGKSRFPLITKIVIQPTQSDRETFLQIQSRPSLLALIPVFLLGLLLWSACLPIILEDGLNGNLILLMLSLWPYLVAVLFFNIELKILINEIQKRVNSIRF